MLCCAVLGLVNNLHFEGPVIQTVADVYRWERDISSVSCLGNDMSASNLIRVCYFICTSTFTCICIFRLVAWGVGKCPLFPVRPRPYMSIECLTVQRHNCTLVEVVFRRLILSSVGEDQTVFLICNACTQQVQNNRLVFACKSNARTKQRSACYCFLFVPPHTLITVLEGYRPAQGHVDLTILTVNTSEEDTDKAGTCSTCCSV